jgi:hypothetical protein
VSPTSEPSHGSVFQSADRPVNLPRTLQVTNCTEHTARAAIYSYGRIEVQFQHLKPRAPLDDEQTRLEQLKRVIEWIEAVASGAT